MILVYYNQSVFEYDVHSLIKAFFPKDEVQMYYLFAGEEARENLACMPKEAQSEEELPLKDASHLLRVHYDASGMELIWRMLEQGEEKKKVFDIFKNLYQQDCIPKESITFTHREALEQYMAGKIVFFQGLQFFLSPNFEFSVV